MNETYLLQFDAKDVAHGIRKAATKVVIKEDGEWMSDSLRAYNTEKAALAALLRDLMKAAMIVKGRLGTLAEESPASGQEPGTAGDSAAPEAASDAQGSPSSAEAL